MPLIYQEWIVRHDLHANRDRLYIFGDNEERRGMGGQAGEMRGEPNAHGIRVKKAPSMERWALWSDDDFDRVTALIKADLEKPYRFINEGKTVVVSTAGIGTERAALEYEAPRVFEFLMHKLHLLEQIGADITR